MVILNQKRHGAYEVATGADRVVAGVAVPRGASVLQVSGHIDVQCQIPIITHEFLNYSIRGYLIPVPDFDTPDTYDDLWDRLVPKDDAATDTIDVDEAAADTQAIDQIGLPDLETILGVRGTKITSVFKRQEEVSYASNAKGFHIVSTVPFYFPGWRVPIKINRKVSAKEPSVLLFALSNPGTGTPVTALHSSPTITEWARMLVLEHTLQEMMLNFLGAVEAGAETPYVEAQALIVKLMEPTAIEEAARAGAFSERALDVNAKLNFKVQYPMKSVKRELTSTV